MKLALLGDIALFGNLSIKNNSRVLDYFKDVESYLSTVDLVVGNLETPFSIKKKTHGAKSAFLCTDPENIIVLKYLHLGIVNLANNHTYDYGREGLEVTKQILLANGIDFFGVDGKEVLYENDDCKLAFTGYCCYSSGPYGCVKYGKPGINEYDLGTVQRNIKKYKNEGEYINVVSVHSGTEHVNYPSTDTIKAAKLLSNQGSLIYYGHHPHVAQGVEFSKDALIAYSLGNFCFDDVYSSSSSKPTVELSENNRSSFILEICIEKNKVTSYRIVPIYIGKDSLILGKGATGEVVKGFTDKIHSMNEADYTAFRNDLIRSYTSDRKSKRGCMWYIRRLRPRYVIRILNIKVRTKKYRNKVLKYLYSND